MSPFIFIAMTDMFGLNSVIVFYNYGYFVIFAIFLSLQDEYSLYFNL